MIGRGADVEWVRQKSVHRILDSLARDIILRRPADVLLHIQQWAAQQLSHAKSSCETAPATADPPPPPSPPRSAQGAGAAASAQPSSPEPHRPAVCAESAADSASAEPSAFGAGNVTPQRRYIDGDSTCLHTPGDSPLNVAAAERRASLTRRTSRRGSHQGPVPPPGADEAHPVGERRRTPPQPATADPGVPEDCNGTAPHAPPEVDPTIHQHKWDPAAPVDWRPSPEALGAKYPSPIGLLEFTSEIDAGHYGRVYDCVRKSDGMRLAVKKVPIEGDWVEQEIDNLRHCECDWVIRLVDAYYCIEEDKLWIAMERVGASLAMVAEAAGDKAFGEGCIAEICRQILCALEAIHSKCRVHLDVKPGNLLVGSDGQLRLADFGTMQPIGEKCEQLGDFAFMAPEVAYSSGLYMGESDIWSCGITCLYLADGEAPLATDKPELLMYIHRETCLSPRLWKPGAWSPEFSDFLGLCFLKDAADRPSASKGLQHPWVVGKAERPLSLPPPLGPAAHMPP